MYIKPFSELSKGDAAIAGGKGASLGEMTNAGVPVPPGFVVLSDAFEKFLEETDLNVEIDSILHGVDTKAMHTIEHASETIQKLILEARMPEDIAREILDNFKKLDARFVAVRSSATAEDSASAAWAGQLDSFLNTTEETLLKNVQRCFASLFTPRAIFYRFEQGLHESKISVAVVVQKMVESEVSGIAFSVHPVTEDYNQLIIEAGFGLGEAIVSGQITPDSYVVEKEPRRIVDVNVSEQERGIYRKSSNGENEWQSIPVEKRNQQKLSNEQILELSEIILHIEKHYGFPCDIEWAFEGGAFYIVQSRPITTLGIGQSYSSQDKKIWVKNFSGNEVGLQIFSVFYDGMKNIETILFGHDQLPIITEIFWHMKGVDLEGAYFLKNEMYTLAEKICEAIYADPEKIKRIHKEAYALNDEYFSYTEKHLKDDLHQLSDKELGEIYVTLTDLQIRAHGHAATTTWFVDSTDQIFSQRLILETKDIVEKSGTDKNPMDVFTLLTTSTQDTFALQEEQDFLEILRMIQADKEAEKVFFSLSQYSEMPGNISDHISEALRKHCTKWQWVPFGYLGPAYELDHYLFDMATLVKLGKDANQEIKEKKEQREVVERERDMLFKELCIDEGMRRIYDVAADITLLKTYRKDCLYHGMYLIDKLFREMKDRLKIDLSDMHYLYHTEIKDIFISGKTVYKERISQRKKSAVSYKRNNEEIQVLTGREAENFLQDSIVEEETNDDQNGVLKGTCACSGFARGTVKIINRPEEMGKMEQGDIMVSHTTFPSLVPAMKKAAAIVTEDGGITCHAAIVAREWKTPCITGIKNALQVLKDGDLVEVDADNGVVRILERASKEEILDKVILKKNYSRDLSLILEQLWVSGFKRMMLQYPDYKNPYEPYVVFFVNGENMEIWENEQSIHFFQDWLLEKNKQGTDFLQGIIHEYEKLVVMLEGYWRDGGVSDHVILKKYLEISERAAGLFFVWYYTGTDDRMPKTVLKMARDLREKDEFFAKNDKYIKECVVALGGKAELANLIFVSEFPEIPSEDELRQRVSGVVVVDGDKEYFSSLLQFSEDYPKYEFEGLRTVVDLVDEFLGWVAQRGRVKGIVRIVKNKRNVERVHVGDIIVSPMTTPDFLPAMKKASAFITDEGGITCHAAIVARELKKPCIIGTKIATQVLKDGDLVEVDADNGVVRVLEK